MHQNCMNIGYFNDLACFNSISYFIRLGHISSLNRHQRHQGASISPDKSPQQLSSRRYSIYPRAALERLARSFEQCTRGFSRFVVINRASRNNDALFVGSAKDNDLLRVSEHSDVSVVRYDDHLSPLLGASEDRYHTLVDEFAVEIILRLINDERSVAVSRKHDCKQNGLLLAERELAKFPGPGVLFSCTIGYELCDREPRTVEYLRPFQPKANRI